LAKGQHLLLHRCLPQLFFLPHVRLHKNTSSSSSLVSLVDDFPALSIIARALWHGIF
jgi:hypothetical protein